MKLTEDQIIEINKKVGYDNGIYVQPTGVPSYVKDKVIVCRYETGGMTGGSCWGIDELQSYTESNPEDSFVAIDLVLEILKPNISYLQYEKIERLIQISDDRSYGYYGNRTDYETKYIILSELEELLETL